MIEGRISEKCTVWDTGMPRIGAVYIDDDGCLRCALDGRKVKTIRLPVNWGEDSPFGAVDLKEPPKVLGGEMVKRIIDVHLKAVIE